MITNNMSVAIRAQAPSDESFQPHAGGSNWRSRARGLELSLRAGTSPRGNLTPFSKEPFSKEHHFLNKQSGNIRDHGPHSGAAEELGYSRTAPGLFGRHPSSPLLRPGGPRRPYLHPGDLLRLAGRPRRGAEHVAGATPCDRGGGVDGSQHPCVTCSKGSGAIPSPSGPTPSRAASGGCESSGGYGGHPPK